MLAATWNSTDVPVGVLSVNESVVQFGTLPAAGFASFSDDTNVPVEVKPGLM